MPDGLSAISFLAHPKSRRLGHPKTLRGKNRTLRPAGPGHPGSAAAETVTALVLIASVMYAHCGLTPPGSAGQSRPEPQSHQGSLDLWVFKNFYCTFTRFRGMRYANYGCHCPFRMPFFNCKTDTAGIWFVRRPAAA